MKGFARLWHLQVMKMLRSALPLLILTGLSLTMAQAQDVFESNLNPMEENHLARVRNQRLLQSRINRNKGEAINRMNRYNDCQQKEAAKPANAQNAMNCVAPLQKAQQLQAQANQMEQQFNTMNSSAALGVNGFHPPVRTITGNAGKPVPPMPHQFSGPRQPGRFGNTAKPHHQYPSHPYPHSK